MKAKNSTGGRTQKTIAWERLNAEIITCARCPRLRQYCAASAEQKRRSFQEWSYWGRPVPNFGDPRARLLIVGLAPAAHGANRTGRVFTGDRSGDWPYRALHRAGFANQPRATHAEGGLTLTDCAVTAATHCAPPDNKPTPEELNHCESWLQATVDLLPVRVFLALGQIGWRTVLHEVRRRGWHAGKLPKFGHGAEVELVGGRRLIASYHPSQQNTFTGVLTEEMLDAVCARARELLRD